MHLAQGGGPGGQQGGYPGGQPPGYGQGPPYPQQPGPYQQGPPGGYPQQPGGKGWGGPPKKSNTTLIVVVIVVVLLLIGGGLAAFFLLKEDETNAYMADVCSGISSWDAELTQVQAEFTFPEGTPPDQVKQQVDAALASAIDDTNSFVQTLRGIDPPDVENGEEAHNALIAAVERVAQIFQEARDFLAPVPSEDTAALTEAFNQAAAQIQTGVSEAFTAVDAIEAPELEKAQDEVEECEEFRD